ncbi:MAG: DNA-directed DNA polymerase II small subunit [Candidatus Heimdallarchaeota archaeon]|nr:DNA-directed DNA polymerase II small subunit [Candidatus Heimdallarchaeota archaeon]
MSDKKDLVSELLDRYCLITPEAHEILEDMDIDIIDIDKLVDALKNELVVTADKLNEVLASYEETLSEGFIEKEQLPISLIEKEEKNAIIDKEIIPILDLKKKAIKKKMAEFTPLGRTIKTKLKVLNDSSRKTTVEGTIENFQKYFNNRYNQIATILKKRGDISPISISEIYRHKTESNEQIALIAMVNEKYTLKNGGMILEVEDPTGQLKITISSKMQELITKAGKLLNDQIAGFYGSKFEDAFLLNEFVFPDIPIIMNRGEPIDDPINVCMISDLHIGSKEFLEDSFRNLIDFLNGKVDDPYQQSIASQVKYLIINGDLVEGIGVYPKQEDDLIITDIYDQYKYATKLIDKIPDWIHILIVSGNHDACRMALPQPAIGKEYAPELWNMKNVTMLSNPSTVELHKKIFLIYHGNSFEDISSLTPGLSMNDPNGPMIHTLRFRHLAPTFGRRTSIVPSVKDELVIEKVPHVYHTGHVHINSHTQYRGVECINSGTFQSQTDYMLSKNIIPTPGRVPILNLQTNKLHELVFYQKEEVKR